MVAVGTKPPQWACAAYDTYARRMPPHYRLELLEVAPGKRGKNLDAAHAMDDETQRIRRVLPPRAYVVVLDRKGRTLTSEELARALETWSREGRDVAFVIGGPDGLPDVFLQQAQAVWSFSQLTFPHMLMRVMLAEQLYRAWSIGAGLPYHRSDPA